MRHGRTALDPLHRSDGWLDLPLSDKGRMGLIPAQQLLKLEPIKAIYSSPLRRTTETAHIVASGIVRCPSTHQAQPCSTWNLGVMAGMPKEETKPKVKELLAKPDTAPMGGESYNAFKKRFMSWFRERVRAAGEKPILIVLSGSCLRLLGTVLFNNSKEIDLDEGGLAALHQEKGAWHAQRLIGEDADPAEVS
jgi:probable phosphoglycerate mutase